MDQGKTPEEVEWAISQLQGDRRITGRCPHCDEEFPMKTWRLFYGDKFPKDAQSIIERLYAVPEELKKQYQDLKRDSTSKTAEISVRVKVGQVVEQIIPGLPTFPYMKDDCRSLFKPIDYIVFNGLAEGKVEHIHFLDVKTGKAGMNAHEKEVEKVVNKKNVEFVRY